MTEKPLIYLACPYSHENKAIMEERFIKVNYVAGILMNKGLIVFSPISHCHPIASICDLPKGFDFWEKFDRTYLSLCHSFYILCISGWKESTGLTKELDIAMELGLHIKYVNINGDFIDAISA